MNYCMGCHSLKFSRYNRSPIYIKDEELSFVDTLIDDGTINAFFAHPSIIALKSIWVMVTGVSQAKSMDLISKELGSHESIYFVVM